MPKRDAAHMNTQRERIVRAAIECMGEYGIKRTSIAGICRKAKLSAGAIYVHFRNKDEIIAEALRFGALTESMLPESWTEFKTGIIGLDPQKGFDISVVARARLQLLAECAHPGPLHDLLKPQLLDSLSVLILHLQKMADDGRVKLRMTPRQTALGISAFVDGMLWIALSSDRPLGELKADLAAGLDCFVLSAE